MMEKRNKDSNKSLCGQEKCLNFYNWYQQVQLFRYNLRNSQFDLYYYSREAKKSVEPKPKFWPKNGILAILPAW